MYPKSDVTHSIETIYGYFNEKYSVLWKTQIEELKTKFGDQVVEVKVPYDEKKIDKVDLPTLTVKQEVLFEVLSFLKNEQGYNFLTDATATDESESSAQSAGEQNFRFLLVYHLFNTETKARIRIKAGLAENQIAKSMIPLWIGANWAEREIFDMFGIQFEGHPDLRRILMDNRFEGHPLRKDYPLRGYQVFLTPEPIDPELLK